MTKHALVRNGTIIEFRDYAPVGDQSLLAPGKPRMLPVVIEGNQFNEVTQVREGPSFVVEATRVREVYTTRNKNAAEISLMKEDKIASVRGECSRRLNSTIMFSAQIQALTRLVQLIYSHTDRTGWPAGERALAAAMLNRLSNIQSFLDVQDAKIADVTALNTPTAINSYDETVGWP